MMHITQAMLEKTNTLPCGQKTVGAYVDETGGCTLWSDRSGTAVDVIVIHYMSAIISNPLAPYAFENIIALFSRYGVSTHYFIDRDGQVVQCVPEDKKAWHAGNSIMPPPDNRTGVNDFSLGIELLATHESGFTDEQYHSLVQLCSAIETRLKRRMLYVGHDVIAGERAVAMGIRNDIKSDPGPLFNWKRLYDGLLNDRIEV